MAVTKFDEFLSRIVKIGAFVVLILAIIWFFGGFNKTKKPVAEVLPQSKQQCMEHTMCNGHEQAPEIKRTVSVTLEEILPPPPPCGVQNINIDKLTVQTQIINNDTTVCKPVCKPQLREREIEEQGALMEYTDRSGGHAEVRSSYYGGVYYYGGGGNNSSGWNSQNARVHQGTPHNWQQDTRCGRRVR